MRKKNAKYSGCIDSIHKGNVNGWVYDRRDKNKILTITLSIDGRKVSTTQTNVLRKDVAWTYGCHELCGFSIPIPIDLISNGTFSYEVVVDDEPPYSVPSAGNINIDMGSIINLPSNVYDVIKLKNSLIEVLMGHTDALIRLNNSSDIRLSNIDPLLAKIILVNGARGTSTELYRTYALAHVIREMGITSLVYNVEDIPHLPYENIDACVFIRVAATTDVTNYISKLKHAGVKVISDFDDLVFRPSLLHKIDGVRFLREEEKQSYAFGMMQYREMIRMSDQVWTTTKRLATEVSSYNRNVVVINNYPLPQTRKEAAKVNKNWAPDGFVIGYYSGTLTHQADFKVCSNAIADFLDKYSNARLRLVGEIDLTEFPELAKSGQVDRVGLMDYQAMIQDLAECNIVLAPLVIGDDFCESKSELKYFDAALCYVPIIASGTDAFKEAIKHGINGFIADTEGDWFNCLVECYKRPRLLKTVSLEAHRAVINDYSLEKQISAYQSALKSLGIIDEIDSAKPQPLTPFLNTKPQKRLAVLLPDIMIGSGGHRKVLTFCNEYSLMGGFVDVLFVTDKTDQELKNIVEKYYFPMCGEIRAYNGTQPNADIMVATSWYTAYIVDRWVNPGNKYYFVQDFEPMFNAVNTDYVLAYNSYRLDLNIIPFGQWNAKKLNAEFGYELDAINFPVDREVYFKAPIERSKNTILFYARPSQPRRLYELGHHALLALRSYLPSWNFVYYGEDIRDAAHQGIQHIGKKTDLRQLRDLYSSSTFGIAFSTTNPSLIPFEMLACGLPLVDVNLAKSNPDFNGCESIVYSKPTVDDLSKTIFQLAIDGSRLSDLSYKALKWSQQLPTESQFAQTVLNRLTLI
jgi:glycosyltransferase involved in cell wall biosynthesis